MPYIPPKDRVLENSTSNSQTVFAVTGAIDTSFNAFSASMAVNDWTLGCVSEPGVAFASGKLTYSATNQITVDSTFGETKGTFSASGTKEVFMGFPAVQNVARFDALAYNGMQINGSMEVSQENGTTVITAGSETYIIDGWKLATATGFTITGQQVADAPPGYQNSLKANTTTGTTIASGTTNCILTKIEGYRVARLGFGAAGAQSVSIGFWVKATKTGTMGVALLNSALTRSYVTTVAINAPNTWEFKTVTISGDASGTWLLTTGVGLHVYFNLGIGSTYQTTAGSWQAGLYLSTSGQTNFNAATNDAVQITGVVVLPGIELPSAARAPLIMRPFDQEFLLSRRYYRLLTQPKLFGTMNSSTSISRMGAPLDQPMRVAPTLTMTGNLPIVAGSAATTISTIDTSYSTASVVEIDATATSGAGISAGFAVTTYQSGSAALALNARL